VREVWAARPTTDIASQYIPADKPEVTASYTSQEVTTSFPILHTQTVHTRIKAHNGAIVPLCITKSKH